MLPLDELKAFEQELNSFDAETRRLALNELAELAVNGKIKLDPPTDAHNLHCHTFFSYNGYGYSPSYIAWLAKKSGWFAVGCVDFDVLDAVDEFMAAGRLLGIKTVCGMESRVFIGELSEHEINSPGEPGVSYHMGAGFYSGTVPAEAKEFLGDMRRKANARTCSIVDLVNPFLSPAAIDFEQSSVELTPKDNITERHVCEAYRLKAEELYPDVAARIDFWAGKLSTPADEMAKIIENDPKLEGLIRSKTMKSGGVGYVKADPSSFPRIEDMNEFSNVCGAIPVITWLNGESSGESDPDALIKLHLEKGAELLNIVPDRNWNFPDAEVASKKMAELDRIIAAAIENDIPVIVGTEMNAPGLKLVDTFESEALAKHTKVFVDGAAVTFAHTLLEPFGFGLLSDWAYSNFTDRADRNAFFVEFGRKAGFNCEAALKQLSGNATPAEILALVAE
jgi:hypothetical protein